jgi:hypothetical protein
MGQLVRSFQDPNRSIPKTLRSSARFRPSRSSTINWSARSSVASIIASRSPGSRFAREESGASPKQAPRRSKPELSQAQPVAEVPPDELPARGDRNSPGSPKTCNVPRTNRIRVPMARCGSEIKMTQAFVRLPAGGFRLGLSVTQGLPTER